MAERRRLGVAGIVALVLALMLVMAVLLTPASQDTRGSLASTSTGAGGARLLHDMLQRSGWRVERMVDPIGASLSTDAVYAVLDPPLPLTSGEVHTLLQAVRSGARLLVVVPDDGPLADSLGITHSKSGGSMYPSDEAPAGFCPDSLNRVGLINWTGGRVQSWWLRTELRPAVVFTHVLADTVTSRMAVTRTPTGVSGTARVSGPVPAMAGYTFGRGRVVAVADPDLLRNDVLRVCRWNAGPNASRALEWLATGIDRRLVFAEYYQDPSMEANPIRAVGRALIEQPWGRMFVALSVAGLVLLAAMGMRPLRPLPHEVVRRRSPLEHAEALARAYESAGATRIATRRLVRGLRRRHSLGANIAEHGDDVERLDAIAARYPAIASDVAFLERGMATAIADDDLTRLGDAAARVDATISTRSIPRR